MKMKLGDASWAHTGFSKWWCPSLQVTTKNELLSLGTSLVVQGLGIHLPTQEAQLPSLAGDKRPRATGQRTHTQGSLHHSGRPYTLQLRPDTVKDINSLKKNFPNFTDYAKAFDCVNHNKLWKILKEMGIPDHLTCLLRNLCAGQEAS